jgi:hypothetical protein
MDLYGLKMGWLLWSFLDSKWASSSGFYRPRNSVVSMAYQALCQGDSCSLSSLITVGIYWNYGALEDIFDVIIGWFLYVMLTSSLITGCMVLMSCLLTDWF